MEKDRFCYNCISYNPNNHLCKKRDILRLEKDWCFEFNEKTATEEREENKTMNLNYENFDEAYNDFVIKKYGTKDLQEIIKIADEIRRAAEERIDDAKRSEFDDLTMDIYDMLMKMAKLKSFIKVLNTEGDYVVIETIELANTIGELKY